LTAGAGLGERDGKRERESERVMQQDDTLTLKVFIEVNYSGSIVFLFLYRFIPSSPGYKGIVGLL